MPNEKVFNMMNMDHYLMCLISGEEAKPTKVDMYRAAEAFYQQVIIFMDNLKTDKTIVYEHTETHRHYRWQRKGKDQFVMQVLEDGKPPERFEVDAQTVLNTIFKHAPFIEFIGAEMEMNL